jgi:tRNA threonylcarbamoyladenosine biosynthesis protein TsaE
MVTDMTWQTNTTTSEQTEALGEHIGRRLRGGEVIALASDLGGGKTTFTRGLARGAGSLDRVASPTFTISKEYVGPKFTIVHFDFYRLQEAGVVAEELREYIGDPNTVVVVEWGEIVEDVLPADRLTVEIKHQSGEGRELTFQADASLKYLLEGMK